METATELRWFKSSFSGGSESECVEAAFLPERTGALVRDSKDPHGAVLDFRAGAWSAFVADVAAGGFDFPQT